MTDTRLAAGKKILLLHYSHDDHARRARIAVQKDAAGDPTRIDSSWNGLAPGDSADLEGQGPYGQTLFAAGAVSAAFFRRSERQATPQL
jgi:hypothetical protein